MSLLPVCMELAESIRLLANVPGCWPIARSRFKVNRAFGRGAGRNQLVTAPIRSLAMKRRDAKRAYAEGKAIRGWPRRPTCRPRNLRNSSILLSWPKAASRAEPAGAASVALPKTGWRLRHGSLPLTTIRRLANAGQPLASFTSVQAAMPPVPSAAGWCPSLIARMPRRCC